MLNSLTSRAGCSPNILKNAQCIEVFGDIAHCAFMQEGTGGGCSNEAYDVEFADVARGVFAEYPEKRTTY